MLLQHRADRLIRAYRERGHIQAKVDPLVQNVRYVPELDPQYYGFGDADMDKLFVCESMRPQGRLTLQTLISRLREVYCESIGFQYLHIDDGKMRHWVQEEPENMGAWHYLRVTGHMSFLGRLPCTGVCRSASASPATGSHAVHLMEQEQLLKRAFQENQSAPRPHAKIIPDNKQLANHL